MGGRSYRAGEGGAWRGRPACPSAAVSRSSCWPPCASHRPRRSCRRGSSPCHRPRCRRDHPARGRAAPAPAQRRVTAGNGRPAAARQTTVRAPDPRPSLISSSDRRRRNNDTPPPPPTCLPRRSRELYIHHHGERRRPRRLMAAKTTPPSPGSRARIGRALS